VGVLNAKTIARWSTQKLRAWETTTAVNMAAGLGLWRLAQRY